MPMTNLINVCAQCGQTGRNADKFPHHTSKFNYVRMVLHCAMQCTTTHVFNSLLIGVPTKTICALYNTCPLSCLISAGNVWVRGQVASLCSLMIMIAIWYFVTMPGVSPGRLGQGGGDSFHLSKILIQKIEMKLVLIVPQ